MKLQAKLDALRADFEANKAPPEVVAVMHRATAALAASGQADRAKKAGEAAPAFLLLDADGTSVDSAALLAKGPLVVTFYRGIWCPYCNMDLQAIEEIAGAVRAAGASLVAISPQQAANSRRSQRENKLSFPILIDQGGAVADAFGLRFQLPDELVAVYKSFGLDLPSFHGEPSWSLPMPARFVIAPDGRIAYAEVHPDYTRRPEPSDLLPVLQRLNVASAA